MNKPYFDTRILPLSFHSEVPDVEYQCGEKRGVKKKKKANDGAAPGADEELSPRNKSRVESFFLMTDVLEANSSRRATI